MTAEQPWELSLDTLASRYRDRSLSPVEVVDSLLDRIERWRSPLNCFVEVDGDRAREAAVRARESLAKGGDGLPPLLGVPIAVKDNIDVLGWRTTGGSTVLDAAPRSASAPVVAGLQERGAIVIGKTNLYELAFGDVNPRFGEVRNPWDLRRNCSASSSGSACAVAARLAAGALGTDTGGSVRLPAAACGVVGVKPTRGLMSLRGVVTVSSTLDVVGPIARTVLDAAVLLEAMCRGEGFRVARDELVRGAQGLVIGVPRRQATEVLDPEVAAELERCCGLLERDGARLVAVDLPDYLVSREVMWTVSGAEMAEHWGREVLAGAGVSDGVRRIVAEATLIRAVDYLRAQRVRGAVTAAYEQLFREVDAVIMPVAPSPASSLADGVVDVGDLGESYMASLTRYCPVANVGGFPAVSVPTGRSAGGLPLSVQLVAGHHREGVALRAAATLERLGSDLRWTVPSAVRDDPLVVG
jgi:aspartyl-tRNA(Asn)/glutamyl-tRNA(Gln) amidotransferase subunit A